MHREVDGSTDQSQWVVKERNESFSGSCPPVMMDGERRYPVLNTSTALRRDGASPEDNSPSCDIISPSFDGMLRLFPKLRGIGQKAAL
jgi:hypothetical protein